MIERSKKRVSYTAIKNRVLRCGMLHADEIGLYAVMLSRPDYWEFSEFVLARELDSTPNEIRFILKRMEQKGFTRERRGAHGPVWDLIELSALMPSEDIAGVVNLYEEPEDTEQSAKPADATKPGAAQPTGKNRFDTNCGKPEDAAENAKPEDAAKKAKPEDARGNANKENVAESEKTGLSGAGGEQSALNGGREAEAIPFGKAEVSRQSERGEAAPSHSQTGAEPMTNAEMAQRLFAQAAKLKEMNAYLKPNRNIGLRNREESGILGV